MTVYFGSITGSTDGWTFTGKFGPKDGPPKFAIVGGLPEPIQNLTVPQAELVNPEIKSYEYTGEIGPEYINLHSTTKPAVIILGELGVPVRPTKVKGWLEVTSILRE